MFKKASRLQDPKIGLPLVVVLFLGRIRVLRTAFKVDFLYVAVTKFIISGIC